MLTTNYITVDPHLSLPVLVWLGAGFVILAVLSLLRASGSRIFRLLFFATFFLLVVNPVFIEESREPLPSTIAVVVDNSESMRFGDRQEIARNAERVLSEKLGSDEKFELRIVRTNPDEDSTQLITALRDTLIDIPREQIGGAVLLSDGQVHDIPADLRILSELGPIHTVITGDPTRRDRRLEIIKRTSFGVVGDKVRFVVKVTDPASAGQPIPLTLSINAQKPMLLSVIEGVETQVDIVVERRGENIAIFEIAPGGEELTLANNARAETISGVFDRLRVLLISGQPNESGRVWRDLLKSDPSVDLVHFTILRPPFKSDGARMEELSLITFPTDALFRDKLDRFNLIIFDQYERRHVITDAYLDNMARYVDDGGALLVVSGPPFASRFSIARSPLRSVLPASPTSNIITGHFRPSLSAFGTRHAVTAPLTEQQQDWGGWYRYIEAESDVGDVLMQTPKGAPLLVLNRVGQGRVGQLLSDQIWLWAREHEGGGPYIGLIRRMVHWLMKEPELEERRLSMQMNTATHNAVIRLNTISNDTAPLLIESPEGQISRSEWTKLEDGVFVSEIATPELGLYRARSGGLQALGLKGPANAKEYSEPGISQALLEPVSRTSQGGVFSLHQAQSPMPEIRAINGGGALSGQNWLGFKHRNAYIVRNSRTKPLIPSHWGVALFLLASILLWWREGR